MTYIPIPVAVAQQIGDGHKKDIVLIVGWDQASNKTAIVTWGREPPQKEAAAEAGETIAKQLGLIDELAEVHEDFRREGEAAKEVDRLRAAIGTAVRGIRAEYADGSQGSSETLGKSASVHALVIRFRVGGKSVTEHERVDELVEKFCDDRGAMTMGEVMELLDLMIALRLREDAQEDKSGHCARCGRVRCGP